MVCLPGISPIAHFTLHIVAMARFIHTFKNTHYIMLAYIKAQFVLVITVMELSVYSVAFIGAEKLHVFNRLQVPGRTAVKSVCCYDNKAMNCYVTTYNKNQQLLLYDIPHRTSPSIRRVLEDIAQRGKLNVIAVCFTTAMLSKAIQQSTRTLQMLQSTFGQHVWNNVVFLLAADQFATSCRNCHNMLHQELKVPLETVKSIAMVQVSCDGTPLPKSRPTNMWADKLKVSILRTADRSNPLASEDTTANPLGPEQASTSLKSLGPHEIGTSLKSLGPEQASTSLKSLGPKQASTSLKSLGPKQASTSVKSLGPKQASTSLKSLGPKQASTSVKSYGPEQASTSLKSLGPKQASTSLKSLGPHQIGTSLKSYGPEQASTSLKSLGPHQIGTSLKSLGPEQASTSLKSLGPKQASTSLKSLGPHQIGTSLKSLGPEQASTSLISLGPKQASTSLKSLGPEQASTSLKSLGPKQASTSLKSLGPHQIGTSLKSLGPEQASTSLKSLGPHQTGTSLKSLGPEQASTSLKSLGPKQASTSLKSLGPEQASTSLKSLGPHQIGTSLKSLGPEQASTSLKSLGPKQASTSLKSLGPKQASTSLKSLDPKQASTSLKLLGPEQASTSLKSLGPEQASTSLKSIGSHQTSTSPMESLDFSSIIESSSSCTCMLFNNHVQYGKKVHVETHKKHSQVRQKAIQHIYLSHHLLRTPSNGLTKYLFDALESYHMSSDWRTLARELGFKLWEVCSIASSPLSSGGPQTCLEMLLDKWLNWAPPNHGFPTIEDLITAVRKMGQERLAWKLANDKRLKNSTLASTPD